MNPVVSKTTDIASCPTASNAEPKGLEPWARQLSDQRRSANLDPSMKTVGGIPQLRGTDGEHDRVAEALSAQYPAERHRPRKAFESERQASRCPFDDGGVAARIG